MRKDPEKKLVNVFPTIIFVRIDKKEESKVSKLIQQSTEYKPNRNPLRLVGKQFDISLRSIDIQFARSFNSTT